MKTGIGLALLLSLAIAPSCASKGETGPDTKPSKTVQWGQAAKVHHFGGHYLSGQPSAEEIREARDSKGVKTVLNLRLPEESPREESTVRGLGLQYENVPFRSPKTLSNRVFEDARKILRAHDASPVLMHCSSGNRAGAIWYAFRVLDVGLKPDVALAEAKVVGLKSSGHLLRSIQYVEGELEMRK